LSPSSPRFRADVVFAIHGIFALLIVPCTLLLYFGYYSPQPLLAYAHFAAVVAMVAGTVRYGRCPLVELEERFRTAAGQPMPYKDSFTVYLVESLSGVQVHQLVPAAGSRLVVLITVASLMG
jgi:hypothetical protein